MAGDRVVGQARRGPGRLRRRVLERADAQVARRDAASTRRAAGLARDRVAGRHDASARVVGMPERVHRLADDVLAQHRADGRLAVAARARTASGRSP
jgi:hypothetical protein